jgi:SnoaL-like domain
MLAPEEGDNGHRESGEGGKMKRLLTTTMITLWAALFPAQAQTQDIVSFVPSTPLTPAGIKVPYFDAGQLFGGGTAADVAAINQIWAAYVFYHDTHDGPRIASLFLPDGIWDQGYVNNGVLVPASGVEGNGCLMRGRAQIAEMIGDLETGNAPPLMVPSTGHHKVSSPIIKVEGDTAVMSAPWYGVSYAAKTAETHVGDGGTYLVRLKRTNDQGWMVQAVHIVLDYPKGKPGFGKQDICSLNGPVHAK